MKDNDKFDVDRIIELSKDIVHQNALENIANYNDEMTISQVVRFFEKQGIEFTKTMIQNYVRVNVMPPPIDKRHYIKDHLILLTLISNLKSVYSLDEIKNLFTPILKDINSFDDDMIDVASIYDIYTQYYDTAIEDWKKEIPTSINKIKDLVNNSDVKESEKDSVNFFMTILTLMVQSVATKQYVKLLIEEYNRGNAE